MSGSRRSSPIQPNNAGCLFWLAVIVVVLVLFVLNWGKIQETLATTNFLEIVRTQREKGAEPAMPSGTPSPTDQTRPRAAPVPSATPDLPGDGSADPAELPAASTPAPSPTKSAPAPSSGGQAGASDGAPSTSKPAAPAAGTAKPATQRTRTTALFFVRIDEDGTIILQEVKRQLPASDSPLTDALGALLSSPNEDELRRKLVSLVPGGTKLLSARVRGSTAFLNFNEAFLYNHYGIEGYAGQLKQIVYTATSFPTVQDVQFLIEGESRDYLGEGIYIGKPLSRNSF